MLVALIAVKEELRTLETPILLRITKEHDQLIRGERLEVRDREDLRETFSERFRLQLCPFADDSVQDLVYILIHVL